MHRAVAFVLAMLVATSAFGQAAVVPNPPPAPLNEPTRDEALQYWFARLAAATNREDALAAENEIQRLWLTSGSATIDLLMRQAIQVGDAGNLPLALDLLDGVIALKPEFAEAWHRRAVVHFNMEDYAQAIGDVERALALEPRHFGALAGLGQILYRMGDRERCLKALLMALAIHPYLPGTRDLADDLLRELRPEA